MWELSAEVEDVFRSLSSVNDDDPLSLCHNSTKGLNGTMYRYCIASKLLEFKSYIVPGSAFTVQTVNN